MVKYVQNRVAESSWTLPFTAVYTGIIWVLCGGIKEKWWLQIICLAATTYLMVLLNNKNVLIRIYSRMVSSIFLILNCCACFLFPSIEGAVTSLFILLAYLFLFASYQDETAVGKLYYAFLSIGIASIEYVHILYFVPILLIFTGVYLSAISWRTIFSSLLGIITPYWFALCWCLYYHDIEWFINHFKQLGSFGMPFDFTCLSLGQEMTFMLLIVMMVIGTMHCLNKRYADSIRTRMFYNIFIWTDILAAVFIVLQPQQYDLLIQIMIINTAPITAHFIALTSTRFTNIIFYLLGGITFILTAYNLWTTSYLF